MPNRQRGFTLVEVTIILLVLVTLSSIMLPQLGGFNRLARFVRVREDLGAICSMLKVLLDDTGESAYYIDGTPARPSPHYRPVGLLIGEGDSPLAGHVGESTPWRLPYLAAFTVPTDGGGLEPEFTVDTMSNHLLTNTPAGDGANRWRSPLDMERGRNSLFAWRGPYIDKIAADPWGNRYMANVFALHRPPAAGPLDAYGTGVICLSTGPDSAVDTAFNQPVGWTTGGDDLTALLNAGGPM